MPSTIKAAGGGAEGEAARAAGFAAGKAEALALAKAEGIKEETHRCEAIRDKCRKWSAARRFIGEGVDARQFGKVFRKMLCGVYRVRRGLRGAQAWQYSIPNLEICRADFAQWLGPEIDWED